MRFTNTKRYRRIVNRQDRHLAEQAEAKTPREKVNAQVRYLQSLIGTFDLDDPATADLVTERLAELGADLTTELVDKIRPKEGAR